MTSDMHPPGNGFIAFVIFIALCALAVVFHNVVVAPCRATTDWHTVTTSGAGVWNGQRTYATRYKDNSEWCLWVRS